MRSRFSRWSVVLPFVDLNDFSILIVPWASLFLRSPARPVGEMGTCWDNKRVVRRLTFAAHLLKDTHLNNIDAVMHEAGVATRYTRDVLSTRMSGWGQPITINLGALNWCAKREAAIWHFRSGLHRCREYSKDPRTAITMPYFDHGVKVAGRLFSLQLISGTVSFGLWLLCHEEGNGPCNLIFVTMLMEEMVWSAWVWLALLAGALPEKKKALAALKTLWMMKHDHETRSLWSIFLPLGALKLEDAKVS